MTSIVEELHAKGEHCYHTRRDSRGFLVSTCCQCSHSFVRDWNRPRQYREDMKWIDELYNAEMVT